MDRQTFPDPRVQERLAKLAFIKVNLSRSASPAVVEITRQYKIQGVPTYLFLDPTGREREDLRQVGFVPADDFVKVLDAALAP
jgi:thiol:disulfide interchange protein DsbD